MEETKNLCAHIPVSLHNRIRREQEQKGQTLSQYVTDVLNSYYSLARIRDELTANHVPTPCRVRGWSVPSVRSILSNEKYIGDALLQKTYITDCISKRVKKNRGERPMYYVENHHAPIVSREMFQLVQEEINRRNSKRKVMLKTAKTEQGKYSSKYALSELLVCGECGTPYRRCTWARNGKKHIVWRCISRLEFGTRFCHHSPSLDEEKLKKGIIAALSTYANHREEILDVAMQNIKIVCGSKYASADPVQLQSRLNELTVEQTELLDRILEDMDNPDLNARLSELAAEKKTITEQLQELEQNMARDQHREARMEQMQKWLSEFQLKLPEYDDVLVRHTVGRVVAVDTETIRVRIRDTDVEIEQKLKP